MSNIAVIDKTSQKGIPFASIVGYTQDGKNTGIGETANDKGMAAIDAYDWLSKGVYNIVVSSASYKPVKVNLALQDLDFTAILERNETELGGVIVTSVMKNKNIIMIIVFLIFLIMVTMYAASKNKK